MIDCITHDQMMTFLQLTSDVMWTMVWDDVTNWVYSATIHATEGDVTWYPHREGTDDPKPVQWCMTPQGEAL